jgi:hypothetical protein
MNQSNNPTTSTMTTMTTMARERTPITERIQNYIVAAIECGFDGQDSLTRADCLAIREKTGEKLPRWLMKDDSRRTGRGAYSFPELKMATDAVESNNDADMAAGRILEMDDDSAINANEVVTV